MACSRQAGPAAYLSFIEATTGEHVTQAEWHQIRLLATQHEGGLSRTRVATDEALDAATELAARLVVDRGVEFGAPGDVERFDALADRLYEQTADARNTEGTVAAIRYLSDNGVEETLGRIREGKEKAAKPAVADTATPTEFAGREWADDVYWPNVAKEDREAFAWAADSRTLEFYLPAMDEEGLENKGYADLDSAGQVAKVLNRLPADADDATVIEALSGTELREYFYLADDGGDHPAVTLWEEWKANGPKS